MNTYRYVGATPAELPSLALGHALEPGEVFDAAPGLVNPYIEVAIDDDNWAPTREDLALLSEVNAAAAVDLSETIEAVEPLHHPVAEVLDAVGTDVALAATALALEQTRDTPRKTLVESLDAIANPKGDA
ncbi:MAG: hypothetical protein M3Y26_01330 [Actinomycetota bacterium]|nr:hypothetical protein [Actinomycetota bacterium]